jgi:hypothetical protein
MNSRHRLAIAALSLCFAGTTGAQTVYKSVDEQGRVTYSSSPPPAAAEDMVEKVEIAPGPTQQQKRDAVQRARELQSSNRNAEQQRREQLERRSQSAFAADRELREARIALEEARIQSDDDWQYLAAGGRVLKQSYLDRVNAAERRLQQAEKAASDARRSTR